MSIQTIVDGLLAGEGREVPPPAVTPSLPPGPNRLPPAGVTGRAGRFVAAYHMVREQRLRDGMAPQGDTAMPSPSGSISGILASVAALGQDEDHRLVHAADGEIVITNQLKRDHPKMVEDFVKAAEAEGLDPGAYIIGGSDDNVNPHTGLHEFKHGGGPSEPGGTGAEGSAAGGASPSDPGDPGTGPASDVANDPVSRAPQGTVDSGIPSPGAETTAGKILGGFFGLVPGVGTLVGLTQAALGLGLKPDPDQVTSEGEAISPDAIGSKGLGTAGAIGKAMAGALAGDDDADDEGLGGTGPGTVSDKGR